MRQRSSMVFSERLVTWRPRAWPSQRGRTGRCGRVRCGGRRRGWSSRRRGRTAEDLGGLAGPVLDGVFDEVAEGDDEAAEVPDFYDDVGGGDLFDASPVPWMTTTSSMRMGSVKAIWMPARMLEAVDLAAEARMREAMPAEASRPEP